MRKSVYLLLVTTDQRSIIKLVERDTFLWCAGLKASRPVAAVQMELYARRTAAHGQMAFDKYIATFVDRSLDEPERFPARAEVAPKVHSSPVGSITKIMRWVEKHKLILGGEVIYNGDEDGNVERFSVA